MIHTSYKKSHVWSHVWSHFTSHMWSHVWSHIYFCMGCICTCRHTGVFKIIQIFCCSVAGINWRRRSITNLCRILDHFSILLGFVWISVWTAIRLKEDVMQFANHSRGWLVSLFTKEKTHFLHTLYLHNEKRNGHTNTRQRFSTEL